MGFRIIQQMGLVFFHHLYACPVFHSPASLGVSRLCSMNSHVPPLQWFHEASPANQISPSLVTAVSSPSPMASVKAPMVSGCLWILCYPIPQSAPTRYHLHSSLGSQCCWGKCQTKNTCLVLKDTLFQLPLLSKTCVLSSLQ